VDVVIIATAGINKVPTNAGPVTHITVGSHQAVQAIDTATGGCLVSMGVTSTSRVDAEAVANDSSQSCALALSVAKAIEPNLPSS
jgi:electron transfer flavoprotein alpha/beta subunit